MISLYESILGDIETNLDISDTAAAILYANKPGSELREFFNVPTWVEDPFKFEGGDLLVDYGNKRDYTTWIPDPKKTVKDILGIKLKKIRTSSILNHVVIGHECEDIANTFAPNIRCGSLTLLRSKYPTLNDITFSLGDTKGSLDTINVYSNEPVKLTNVTFDYLNPGLNNILFCRIPVFKNVKFNGNRIVISVPSSVWGSKIDPDVFANGALDPLFEYGYKLTETNTNKTFNIKSFNDIKKLVNAGKFYDRDYDQWPYRIKPNVKVTDLIDISQSPHVRVIDITDKKMGVVLLKPQNDAWPSYFEDMLKTEHDFTNGEYSKHNIVDKIPTTADGWQVIVYKC